MNNDFLTDLGHLGFTARIKRLNEKIVSSTVEHYSNLSLGIEPNWHVIFMLLAKKGKLTVTEIAGILGFSHPAIIKMTRKMKEQGYLDTFKSPQDGRKTFIRLSEKGMAALPLFEKEWFRIREVLQELVADDLLKGLAELEQKFDEIGFKKRYEARFGSETTRKSFTIRNAKPSEFRQLGKLMVDVYSGLEGFPKADAQPQYYKTLAHIGDFTKKPHTELLVAVSPKNALLGGVLYFDDMQYYGSGGKATSEKNASGFRLLAVSPTARGLGVGRALSERCIEKAREFGNKQMVIHTTEYMKVAWKMYEGLGFKRSKDLDFKQGDLQVYGFRLKL